MRRPARELVAACLGAALTGLVAGCGPSSADPDASILPDARPCWPIEGTTAGGSIEVGTGETAFEPMPSEIYFEWGWQGGVFLLVRTRIRGLEPGTPDNYSDANNPSTRLTAILADGTRLEDSCAEHWGYGASDSDPTAFDIGRQQYIEFFPLSIGEDAYNTDITIIAEVIDVNDRIARGEVVVHALPPLPVVDAGP